MLASETSSSPLGYSSHIRPNLSVSRFSLLLLSRQYGHLSSWGSDSRPLIDQAPIIVYRPKLPAGDGSLQCAWIYGESEAVHAR